MSSTPLSGIKILDLALDPGPAPAVAILAAWGAERLFLPPDLPADQPATRLLLLRLAQEAHALVATGVPVDLALLHEYNPMLVVCTARPQDMPWMTACALLAALRERERSGTGQVVSFQADGSTRFHAGCPA